MFHNTTLKIVGYSCIEKRIIFIGHHVNKIGLIHDIREIATSLKLLAMTNSYVWKFMCRHLSVHFQIYPEANPKEVRVSHEKYFEEVKMYKFSD